MSPPAICCGTTPSFCSTRPAKPPMRHFRPLRSSTVLISLRNQPPIWQPVLPASSETTVVFLVELVEQLPAAAQHVPGLVDAHVGPERHRRAEGEGRVLAEVVVRRGVADLDGAVLHGVEHLQSRHDLAAGEGLDLKLVVGGFADHLGHHLGAAIERVERFRPAGRHAPFDFGHRLRDRRRGQRRGTGGAYAGDLEKVSSFH